MTYAAFAGRSGARRRRPSLTGRRPGERRQRSGRSRRCGPHRTGHASGRRGIGEDLLCRIGGEQEEHDRREHRPVGVCEILSAHRRDAVRSSGSSDAAHPSGQHRRHRYPRWCSSAGGIEDVAADPAAGGDLRTHELELRAREREAGGREDGNRCVDDRIGGTPVTPCAW